MDDYLRFQQSALYRRIDVANQRLHRGGRLRWLLEDFLRRRPSERREGELFDLQHDVLAFAGTWGPEDYRHAKLLSAAELDEQFDAVVAGVDLLGQRKQWTPALGPVEYGIVPEAKAAVRDVQESVKRLQRDPLAGPVHARRLLPLRRVYRLQQPTTARLFVNAVLAELETSGRRVARCLKCGNLFASTRRQAFCSIQCAQRVRDARRRKDDDDVSVAALPGHEPFDDVATPKRRPRRSTRKEAK